MYTKKMYYRIVAFLLISANIFCWSEKAMPQEMGFKSSVTPVPIYVLNTSQPSLSLNGKWIFASPGKKGEIVVPSEWVMQGFDVKAGETATYSREFSLPEDWNGQRIKIKFEGVSSHCVVKVNNLKVAEHEGSFVPFEADLTDVLVNGINKLVVEVQANTISDILACTSQYAVHTVGGILRNVSLFVVPQLNISDFTTVTTLQKNGDAILSIKASVKNQSGTPKSGSLRYLLYDKYRKPIATYRVNMQPVSGLGSVLVEKNFNVSKPAKWNAETPYLYTLTSELISDGQILQKNEQKIGFREVKINGNQLMVNGRPVKLKGVNRHSIHPLSGRSIHDSLELADAKLFKAANCNYIRTSHYPPSERFLAIADSIGLYVENESSLTWIQHHASPIWKLWDYKDERFYEPMLAANIEKVQAAKNHASVIIWSLGNESYWSPLWEKVYREVKKLDPTRPVSFHDQCWGSFNNGGNTVEIANYHYPGINGPRTTDTMSRPTLFGEYAHLSTYNRRELLTDPGIRASYGPSLVSMYDSIHVHKGNLGGAIWSGIDDTFHLPDGNIVGYGSWGPVDGWRRLKPEFWGIKKAYSPIVIKNIKDPQVLNGKLTLELENRYDFISLKEVNITYAIDNGPWEIIKLNTRSHAKAIIQIPVKKNANSVQIRFTDAYGNVVAQERYNFKKELPSAKPKKYELTFFENEGAIFINQGVIVYNISKINGVIQGALKAGRIVLDQGPVFCFVERNSEDGGKPNVAGETLQNKIYPIKNYAQYAKYAEGLKIERKDNGLFVTMRTTYIHSRGSVSYLFKNDGSVQVAYEIECDLDKPYQYGLLLKLPKDFDEVSWKREGEFSLYDQQDISRTEGKAKLNAKWQQDVEEFGKQPNRYWKDDANEMGSNDFRATKRNIYFGALTNGKDSVSVISNGKQALRTWFQDDKIQMLIADYYNSGSEPFYGSPFTNDRINTKGKVLKGNMTFRLQ